MKLTARDIKRRDELVQTQGLTYSEATKIVKKERQERKKQVLGK